MRRFIYKAEIDLLLNNYKIDAIEGNRIKGELFKNPISTYSKQYQLLDKINSIADIDKILSKGSNGELFNGAVKDIFDIDEDLRMDERLRELILKNEQVAVFIGAGVSKLLGFPLWG